MEESALMVRGLCRQQGKFELRDISFTLPRGYIMGLVGRMGSGKTTLLKSILNPSLIKSGSVEYEGLVGPGLSSFDTPMERWISNGSRVVHVARVARIAIVL